LFIIKKPPRFILYDSTAVLSSLNQKATDNVELNCRAYTAWYVAVRPCCFKACLAIQRSFFEIALSKFMREDAQCVFQT